jgi:hypothetical protein
MIYIGNKGTEKPIEIFIALFVILAVAMVLLQIVSEYITKGTGEMDERARKERIEQLKAEALAQCRQECPEDCLSLQERAQYCIALAETDGEQGFDVDGDNIRNDYVKDILVGIGICEDQIYCYQLMGDECGCGKLRPEDCVEILCSWWDSEGVDPDKADDLLNRYIQAGKCTMSEEEEELHWYYMMIDRLDVDEGELTCD